MGMQQKTTATQPYSMSESGKDLLSIHLHGTINIENASSILKGLKDEILSKSYRDITIHLDDVSYFDEYGALILYELKKIITAQKGTITIKDKNNKHDINTSLMTFDTVEETAAGKRSSVNFFVRIGDASILQLFNIRYFISFLGSVILSFLDVLKRPRSLRVNDTITCMEKTGVNAVPIVALISFLLGLVMAFMSSLQLKQFGANIYVASLVSIAMVSELGPIMTAIIVAGRSGSGIAAEIGTMKVGEEIDALRSMGFHPIKFLVVPKLIALAIMLPCLTIIADLIGIAGGFWMAVFSLDLGFSRYLSRTIFALVLKDLVTGLIKSVVFALLIGLTGCYMGFKVEGGAEGVGRRTTQSVVVSIFLIILSDAFFTAVFYIVW